MALFLASGGLIMNNYQVHCSLLLSGVRMKEGIQYQSVSNCVISYQERDIWP